MEQMGLLDRMEGMDIQAIDAGIYVVRGTQVMLDQHLATLYRVETGALNRAVKRNRDRFPADFMIQLTWNELESLRCQIGILKRGEHRKYLPYAFTEQGVAMLSSVLRSERAVRVNIEIMRAFVRMRRTLAANQELAKRLERAEETLDAHGAALGEHAKALRTVFDEIRGLLAAPPGPRRRIGFR
jgi:phage regulator Rha-like protein